MNLRNTAKPWKADAARRMRREPTQSERIVWQWLKARRMLGLRFRRQSVIRGWIADFYCPGAKVTIEVDGGYHAERTQADRRRDATLGGMGIRTLRVKAVEILLEPSKIRDRIERWLIRKANDSHQDAQPKIEDCDTYATFEHFHRSDDGFSSLTLITKEKILEAVTAVAERKHLPCTITPEEVRAKLGESDG